MSYMKKEKHCLILDVFDSEIEFESNDGGQFFEVRVIISGTSKTLGEVNIKEIETFLKGILGGKIK